MFDCILLVAGKGERTNLSYNKVLYRIESKPIFRYSLETFLKSKYCNKVILVVRDDEINIIEEEIKDIKTNKIVLVVGGKERQDSVSNGIKHCNSEVVLIHDGARPLVTLDNIESVYYDTLKYSSAVLAVKTIDTIKEIKNGKTKTLNREYLWNIQTPQGVNLNLYKNALQQAEKEKYYSTDDVSLLENYFNISPKVVVGNYQNIKATTMADIKYIEFLIGDNKSWNIE